MLLVLASRRDEEAASYVERWAHSDAVLMTPADLSKSGWVLCADASRGSFVAGGCTYSSAMVSSVLVRLPEVHNYELPDITERDRSYAAAEMTAFIMAWLAALPCLVVNRSALTRLVEPQWRLAKWVVEAERAGIPTIEAIETASSGTEAARRLRWMPVLRGRALDAWRAEHRDYAKNIADRTGLDLFALGFEVDAPGRLAAVDQFPPILEEPLLSALSAVLVPP